jgi:hypothetical protein
MLKAAWQNLPADKPDTALKDLLNKRKHPMLRRMRRQLLFEGVAYLCLLLVYFDFFDGDQKPVYANLLLVAAFVFALINNVAGYSLANLRISGNNVRELLDARISRLKTFAKLSIGSRSLLGVCLLVFFGSVVEVNETRIWIMAGIILTLMIQLAILWKIWSARIDQLKKTRDYFNEDSQS